MSLLTRAIGALGPNRTLAERVALFAAAAAVGPSFEPGLQPRKTLDQAIATGVISATTLSLVTATQSSIDALGSSLMRTRGVNRSNATSTTKLLFNVGTNLAVAGITETIARLLPAHEDEQLRRGLARVAAQRSSKVALAGAGLSAIIGTFDLLAQKSPRLRWTLGVPLALPAGIAASAFEIHRVHQNAEKYNDTTISKVSTRNSVGIAIGVGAGVLALQAGERALASQVSKALLRVAPDYDEVANPIGHFVALGILGGALTAGYEYAIRRVEQGGAAVEPAYEIPPTSRFVSGGPESLIPFATLSREGRRFTNMALTRDEIENVMGLPAKQDPIRLFVGLDSSSVIEERVELLIDELVRTNAFEREVLCFASPTGSGYINYVLAEALEYLALGDSAIATIQYSLLPSPMSLNRTGLAVEQNRAVMYGITGYLRGLAPEKRPKFVLFGESLGALTMQDIWQHRTVEAMERDFVHSSISLGTPSATEFAKAWRLDREKMDPEGLMIELDNFGQFMDLPEEQRNKLRHLLLSHYDDPIPKFGTNLLLRQPWWLGPINERPQGVPKSSRWRPGTTFVLTGVDLINAMEVIPGIFGRRGHDYREDIARFVSEIYDLAVTPAQLEKMEVALRNRELKWAQRRVVTEQVARAKEALTREMKSWIPTDDSNMSSDDIWKQLVASAQADIDAGEAVQQL
jgi:uncharacterized membrane protein